jgi:phosphatidylcholine synthase
VASLFGFANTAAKDETGGFFLGFPSYWNVVAFYAGYAFTLYGAWVNAAVLLFLALLTLLPVRFLYPNLAPRRWRAPLILGALAWLTMMLWLMVDYPRAPAWAVWLSLGYPAFYVWLSWRLARSGGGDVRTATS